MWEVGARTEHRTGATRQSWLQRRGQVLMGRQATESSLALDSETCFVSRREPVRVIFEGRSFLGLPSTAKIKTVAVILQTCSEPRHRVLRLPSPTLIGPVLTSTSTLRLAVS